DRAAVRRQQPRPARLQPRRARLGGGNGTARRPADPLEAGWIRGRHGPSARRPPLCRGCPAMPPDVDPNAPLARPAGGASAGLDRRRAHRFGGERECPGHGACPARTSAATFLSHVSARPAPVPAGGAGAAARRPVARRGAAGPMGGAQGGVVVGDRRGAGGRLGIALARPPTWVSVPAVLRVLVAGALVPD